MLACAGTCCKVPGFGMKPAQGSRLSQFPSSPALPRGSRPAPRTQFPMSSMRSHLPRVRSAVSGDNRTRAVLYEHLCHAREREHPEHRDATRLALRRFRQLPGSCRPSSCPHGWIPAFARMTHAGLAGRDAAVVSRRRLSALRAYHIRELTDGQPDTCHPPAHAEARSEFPARATMPRLRSARLTVPFIHLLYNWIRRRLRRCRVRPRPRRAMLRSNGSIVLYFSESVLILVF